MGTKSKKSLTGIMLVALIILLSSVSVAAAQSGDLIELSERYEVRVPSGFIVQEENDAFVLVGRGWGATVMPPEVLREFSPYRKGGSATDVLVRAAPIIMGEVIRRAEVEEWEIGERVAAFTPYVVEEFDARAIILPMSDEEFGYVVVFWVTGSFSTHEAAVTAMLRSFDVNSGIRRSIAAASGGEPCFVRIGERDTARLRVGPGENRTSIAFLPPDQDFEVTGRFEGDGGDVWFQLIKDEAAPATSAAEIWVAEADVETIGGCEVVGEAFAPPIVPIIPGAGGGGQGGGQTGGGSGAPVVGAVPLGGTWRFDLSPQTNGSCQGTGNIVLNTADVYVGGSIGQLTALEGGARVRYGTDIWIRASDNFYTGNLQFAADSPIPNGVVYLNVVNTTTMTGSLVSNFVIDGTPCSTTVNVTFRRL